MGFFGQPKVQEAYNIIFFKFLMENSILKIFGSMDTKITPDFCSYKMMVSVGLVALKVNMYSKSIPLL